MKPTVAFFATAICLCASFSAIARAADTPNVLVIVTDEHNFRTLGCYRDLLSSEQAEMWGPGSIVETPHLDRLAHEGLICTRAYATAPVCSPCRGAMISGLYPQNNGVPANDKKLRTDIPTIATILGDAGYQTGFIGKWHLGGTGKPEWAPKIDGGFKHTKFMFNRGHWKKFSLTGGVPAIGARNKKDAPSYDVDGADAQSFSTDYLTDRAIEFIDSVDQKPFFAMVSYPDPHGPNTVRAPYDHMYDHLRFLPPRTYGKDNYQTPGWMNGGSKNDASFRGDQMSRYFGMVKCIDDNIGRIFATLEKSGKLDSTIVVMTSDHGDLCYEHDRLNKGNPYEGSARVPMLVRYPKKVAAKTVSTRSMGTVDLTPTILGLAGIQTDATFEGRDLSSAFGADHNGKVTCLRNAGTGPAWMAAIDERYKLIVSVSDKPWLFDSQEDPDELLNFYGRPGTTGVAKRLATELADYATTTNDPFAENKSIAESIRQCLQSE